MRDYPVDEEREKRIAMEVTVDCCAPERSIGYYADLCINCGLCVAQPAQEAFVADIAGRDPRRTGYGPLPFARSLGSTVDPWSAETSMVPSATPRPCM